MKNEDKEVKGTARVIRSFEEDMGYDVNVPKVVKVPALDGSENEGLVVFFKKASYIKPSYL